MPNRILRDWTTSDAIDRLTPEQECTFTRLLMAVDDFGRFEADPRLLAARLYPLRIGKTSAQHMQSTCDALATHGIIKVYQVEGRKYLQIVKWHNVPRAKTSKFPAMPDTCTADAQQTHSTCDASAPVTVTVTDTVTDTVTGTETESCGQAGNTAFPPEASPVALWFPCTGAKDLWPLTQAMIDGWVEAYPAVDVLAECRKAKAWEDSNPKNRKTFDGHARFLNAWMSKAQNQARTVQAQGQPATQEKPRGTWDIEKQLEVLRSDRDRLNRSDFETTSGREAYPEQWAKVQELNAKIRALREQIAGKA